MEEATGYTEEHLANVVEEVKSFALEVNPKFLTTLKYKFNKKEYMEVAQITFRFWNVWRSKVADMQQRNKAI